MTVGRDVNVGRADQRSHLFRSDKPIHEQDLPFHTILLCQGLKLKPVAISFTGSDLRVSGACNHVDSIAVTGQDARHGLDHVFEPFVRRKQTKREKDTLAVAREAILIQVRLLKRQLGNAMRNQVYFLGRNPEHLLQNMRGILAHHNKALGACGNPVHHNPLIQIRLTKHRMQS